jgi:hypothetical protein
VARSKRLYAYKIQRAEGTQRHSGWATVWKTGESGFDRWQEQIFFFPQEPRSPLGAHPASYPMSTEGPFTGGKAVGA